MDFPFQSGTIVPVKRFSANFVDEYRARLAAGKSAPAPRGPGIKKTAPSFLAKPDPTKRIRILGIDTSLRCTGLAVIDAQGAHASFVDCRPIPNPARLTMPECLVRIAETLDAYLDEYKPDEVAMEGIFYCKNVRTTLILGHARGVVVSLCARRHLPIFEYPPTRVKQAVTGNGKATKDQMQRMMQAVFSLPDLPQEDSADALAIALAHVHARRFGTAMR